MSDVTSPSGSVAKAGVGLRAVLVIACVAQFMVVLDSSIVNIALPAMKAGLGLSADTQQWVVNSYLITFGGLLLLASRASDLFGRRRVFQIGLVVFTAASLFGGLAQDGAMLLAARFVQGAGAAALGPASLSLITASHTEPARRSNALKWWGVAASSAGAIGVVLGGLLTASLSWRWVLFINVPIGIALLVATFVCLEASHGHEGRELDLAGAASVTLGVAAVVFGVSSAPDDGWSSPQVLAALIAGAILLGAFLVVERRARQPLVPLGLFAEHNVKVGNVLIVCLGIAITSPLFFLSLYLQQVLGETPLRSGLALLPMAGVLGIGVIVSQRLTPRLGPRRLLVAGGVIAAVGMAWMATIPAHSAYAVHVLLPTLVIGLGLSVMLLPMTVAATSGVSSRDSGVASGLINMGRQIGGAVGLAAFVTIASSVSGRSHGSPAQATVSGYHVVFLIVAGVTLLIAGLSFMLRPALDPPRDEQTGDVTPRPDADLVDVG